MKKNLKRIRKKILITIIILTILLVALLIVVFMQTNTKRNLEYINSDEMNEGTVSPDFIHVVVASYKGKLNPKAISKSTYYFINELVPKYLKKCDNSESARKYFQRNLKDIKLDIGVEKEEEFLKLMEEIQKLTPELKLERSYFNMDEIENNYNNTKANLYIKYENNPEISVKLTISNRIYQDKSTIKFSK